MEEQNKTASSGRMISDPALLFERYNTEEIRGIERKVRGEIEQNCLKLMPLSWRRVCVSTPRPPRSSCCWRSRSTILATATNWEDLEIQEEAESGSSVTSKIRLPVQPTWFVQSLLFQLCVEINRVGGHALPRSTLQEFLQTCLTEVLHHYHSLTQTSSTCISLSSVYQYDLRGFRPVQSSSGFHETCDWLESFIDPFDLDVFTPHLNASLNRLSQRTLVLLGLLTGSEKQFALRSSSLNSQDPYNILPLASSQIRFGLLPLSVSHVQKSKAASRSSEAPQQLVSFAAGSDDSFRPGSLFRQLADQDEDTAATSLFKLNWLSGMGK
uniref:Conserved oligomeric Golgi complex subunit 1 n=1 Tax=Neolamprologus brichardi TaxID=32507 RepID=A0A3Q4M9K9_NEOBR